MTLGRFSDQHSRSELGRAQLRAADAYAVPHAAYMTSGGAGANAVALRAHKLSSGGLKALVAMGANHSIVSESIAIGGSLRFARCDWNARYDAMFPPSPSQIEEALVIGPAVDLVVITSPTYEGFHARIPEIARVARRHGARLHVDATWGPLQPFHPSFPSSPVACGADTASIAVDTLAGALSQSALLTWSDERLDARAIPAAKHDHLTEFPSYLLAASIDDAIVKMSTDGETAIGLAIELREDLEARLLGALPALETLRPDPVVDRSTTDLNVAVDPLAPIDPTRSTINLAGFSVTGFELASLLRAVGIVIERASVHSVTMSVHIGAKRDLPDRVAAAIIDALAWRQRPADSPRARVLSNPFMGLDAGSVIEPRVAMESSLVEGVSVPLGAAAGCVCLEFVEVCPPGAPIGVPGFPLTKRAVDYLTAVADARGQVVSLVPGEMLALPRGGQSSPGMASPPFPRRPTRADSPMPTAQRPIWARRRASPVSAA